jgi:hypothetical protein
MRLTLHEEAQAPACVYRVEGMPDGENARIAEFDKSWRVLRWSENWHGNWAGKYDTPEAALTALQDEILSGVI